jgi:CheY-like chemotaxis protein
MICLLVDDDGEDQEIFSMAVAQLKKDITLITANNGAEAITLVSQMHGAMPDFVFMDINMPKMNGLECLERLRQIEDIGQTRIFMYSTTSEHAVLERSKALGAEGLLVKPAMFVELVDLIAKTLGDDK